MPANTTLAYVKHLDAILAALAHLGDMGMYVTPALLQVIDLSREQERSKQAEAKKAEAEAQRAAQSYAIVSLTLICIPVNVKAWAKAVAYPFFLHTLHPL